MYFIFIAAFYSSRQGENGIIQLNFFGLYWCSKNGNRKIIGTYLCITHPHTFYMAIQFPADSGLLTIIKQKQGPFKTVKVITINQLLYCVPGVPNNSLSVTSSNYLAIALERKCRCLMSYTTTRSEPSGSPEASYSVGQGHHDGREAHLLGPGR